MKTLVLAFSVLLIVASPLTTILHPVFLERAEPYLTTHWSHDNEIEPESRQRLASISYFAFVFAPLALGLLGLGLLNDRLRNAVGPTLLPLTLGILVTIPALPHVCGFGVPGALRPWYSADGPMEMLTAAAFVISAAAFGWAALSAIRMRTNRTWSLVTFWGCAAFSLLAFLLAMEEISWGQRLVGWQTPQFLADVNYQNETNLHNLVEFSSLQQIYRLLALLPVPILIGLWMRSAERIPPFPFLLLPQPNLLGLALLIALLALVSAYPAAELLEELLSLFVLLYSLQLGRRLQHTVTCAGARRAKVGT